MLLWLKEKRILISARLSAILKTSDINIELSSEEEVTIKPGTPAPA